MYYRVTELGTYFAHQGLSNDILCRESGEKDLKLEYYLCNCPAFNGIMSNKFKKNALH